MRNSIEKVQDNFLQIG